MCFKYLWFGRETHPVSKEAIWLPIKKGGLGVLNIKWQCLALKIKQVCQAFDSNNTLPSSRFARYWLHKVNYPNPRTRHNFLPCTEFLPDRQFFASQSQNMVHETFIDLARGSITDFKKLFVNEQKWPTCKQTYRMLMHRKKY